MKIKTAITLVISTIFLVLAVRQFNLDEFHQVMSQLNPVFFIPAVLAYLASFFFRTLRWRIMLRSVREISMRRLFSYIVIGFTANNLLPARLGEFVRAYVTGKQEGMSRSSAFASVVLERLFDGVTIVMLLVILMFLAGPTLDLVWLHYMALVSAGLFLGGLAFLFALAYQRDIALTISEKIIRILPDRIADKIIHILRRFVAGLSLLRHPSDFFLSIVISFGVWGCEVLVYLTYLKAFNIHAPVTAAFLALVVVNLSSLIPSSPSYIGVFQYACIKSLEVFGIGATTALAWSVAVHSSQVIPITLLGLMFLSKLGFSMREISNVELDENGNGEAENNRENQPVENT